MSGLLPLIALCLLILSKPWVSVLSLSHGYSLDRSDVTMADTDL